MLAEAAAMTGMRDGAAESCGSFPMRIAADGTWFHEGRPIRRPELVKLFASVLRRDEDGRFLLVTPVERGTIEVEDAPFTAVALSRVGSGRAQEIRLRTNLDEEIILGPDHPLRVSDGGGSSGPRPYVLVRDGLEARLLRPVYYELVNLGEEWGEGPERTRSRYGIWSQSTFFPLD